MRHRRDKIPGAVMKKPHILIVDADARPNAHYESALADLESPELCFVTIGRSRRSCNCAAGSSTC